MGHRRIDMKGARVLVTGASSSMARAVCDELARRGARLILAGRDVEEVELLAEDLRVGAGAQVGVLRFDAEEPGAGGRVVREAAEVYEGLDGVVAVHGVMWDQNEVDKDPALAHRMAVVNLASVSELAHAAAGVVADGGFVCLVSSVAGDRGRASNLAYGATKAGVNALGEGLRGRLRDRGVRVVVVKPGFVDTAMTWGEVESGLTALPSQVGPRIVRAIERGKAVVYVPGVWRLIMLVIRLIPRPLFDRMNI